MTQNTLSAMNLFMKKSSFLSFVKKNPGWQEIEDFDRVQLVLLESIYTFVYDIYLCSCLSAYFRNYAAICNVSMYLSYAFLPSRD